jgi:hypothetical protein
MAVGRVVTLEKPSSSSEVIVALEGTAVGHLDAVVGPQVASAIERGQLFTAVVKNAYQHEPSANATTWIDLKVEYLLEQGQPAIEIPRAPVAQEQFKGEWKTFYTRVAGVTFTNANGSDRQAVVSRCRAGDRVRFVREPDNPRDPFAVKVVRRNGEQVGYLPSEVVGNRQGVGWCVARGMDAGYEYMARVAGVGKRRGKRYGMSLQVTFWNGSIASQPTEEPELPPIESRDDAAPPTSPSPLTGLAIFLCIAFVAIFVMLVAR